MHKCQHCGGALKEEPSIFGQVKGVCRACGETRTIISSTRWSPDTCNCVLRQNADVTVEPPKMKTYFAYDVVGSGCHVGLLPLKDECKCLSNCRDELHELCKPDIARKVLTLNNLGDEQSVNRFTKLMEVFHGFAETEDQDGILAFSEGKFSITALGAMEVKMPKNLPIKRGGAKEFFDALLIHSQTYAEFMSGKKAKLLYDTCLTENQSKNKLMGIFMEEYPQYTVQKTRQIFEREYDGEGILVAVHPQVATTIEIAEDVNFLWQYTGKDLERELRVAIVAKGSHLPQEEKKHLESLAKDKLKKKIVML